MAGPHKNVSHAGHHHNSALTFNKAFIVAILANSVFVIIQILYAYLANSSSLLADAFHNLGDVLGLILAWVAIRLGQRKPTEKTTYGLKKASILAALSNAMLLVFTCGIIVADAVYKLLSPSEIQALSVMLVAGVGILVNGATAVLFLRGSDDLNIRAAFLHLSYDALVSVGVVCAGALLYWTDWLWVDPVMALLIAFVILKGTWSLFKQSFILIIDGVPMSISLLKVSEFLLAWPGVKDIHDLHVWAISTEENALSVHLYMPDKTLTDEARGQLLEELKNQFGIHHATLQTEKNKTICKDSCHLPTNFI